MNEVKRNRAAAVLVAAAVLALLTVATTGCRPQPVRLGDAVRKGIALGLYASDPHFNYEELIEEIAEHGANSISFVVVLMQDDVASTSVESEPARTVSDRALRLSIRAAHRLGLEVMVLPIVLLRKAEDADWRGTLRPEDVGAWFTSYRERLGHYVRLAEEEGVAWFAVGSELCSLEEQTDEWRRVVREVDAAFSGRLTYSANWDHLDTLELWNELDAMGMSGYFELTDRLDPTLDELVESWAKWRDEIHAARREQGIDDLPLFFTELGYHSQDGTARYPWDYTLGKPLDLEEQRLAYEAFFEAWRDDPTLAGIYIYTWFGSGGPNDGDYTPRGKPAAALIRSEFEGWPERRVEAFAKTEAAR